MLLSDPRSLPPSLALRCYLLFYFCDRVTLQSKGLSKRIPVRSVISVWEGKGVTHTRRSMFIPLETTRVTGGHLLGCPFPGWVHSRVEDVEGNRPWGRWPFPDGDGRLSWHRYTCLSGSTKRKRFVFRKRNVSATFCSDDLFCFRGSKVTT